MTASHVTGDDLTTSGTPQPTGMIADNIVGFARALRAAGMPVGPGAVLDALAALRLIDIGERGEMFSALESVFVTRREQKLIFAQAFDLFFQAPQEWKHLLNSIPLPDHARKPPPPAARRVMEAFSPADIRQAEEAEENIVPLSVSDLEILQTKDFAQMSAAEIAEATRAVKRMTLPQAQLLTRRFRPDARGARLDLRRTFRASLRTGGEIVDISRLGRVDERIYPYLSAFSACGDRCAQARFGVSVRHAAHQCHPRLAAARSR